VSTAFFAKASSYVCGIPNLLYDNDSGEDQGRIDRKEEAFFLVGSRNHN
jgi:hypothetical protein